MNKRLLGLALSGAMVLLAGTASAGVPDLGLSTASLAGGAAGQIVISPSGNGPTLLSKNATITVTVLDPLSNPIAGYPAADINLDDNGNDGLNICPTGSNADANTDGSGVTTFTGSIAGGGSTQAGLQVYLGGNALAGPVLAIDVNSPDIDGDRDVDLLDFGAFGPLYLAGVGGSYDFSVDFNDDAPNPAAINLLDLGVFGQFYLDVCP
jgi:hypothetical protein